MSLSCAQVLARQIIQYAKHIGIHTVNVVRRDEQIEELKALGCAEQPCITRFFGHGLNYCADRATL